MTELTNANRSETNQPFDPEDHPLQPADDSDMRYDHRAGDADGDTRGSEASPDQSEQRDRGRSEAP